MPRGHVSVPMLLWDSTPPTLSVSLPAYILGSFASLDFSQWMSMTHHLSLFLACLASVFLTWHHLVLRKRASSLKAQSSVSALQPAWLCQLLDALMWPQLGPFFILWLSSSPRSVLCPSGCIQITAAHLLFAFLSTLGGAVYPSWGFWWEEMAPGQRLMNNMS